MLKKNYCKVLKKRALHFFNYISVGLLLFSPIVGNAFSYTASVLSQNNQMIKVKVTFEKPEIIADGDKQFAYYKDASFAFDNAGYKIPVINKLISLPGRNPKLRIISQKQDGFLVENYFQGEPGGIDEVRTASVTYVGMYRDLSVLSINLIPVRYSARLKKLTWLKEIIVEIKTDSEPRQKTEVYQVDNSEKQFLNKFLVNGNQKLYKTSQKNNINSATKTNQFIYNNFPVVFKLSVKESGIYKVGFDELVEAGFPAASVNPKNLALYNKGVEVPIFLKGVEDGSFGQADYFEFWGEKNEKTFLADYPDVYSDPFSDTNVYWLVEKNNNGLRLVEESGSIIETDPRKYRVPFKYKETLHFEKDTHRELQGKDPEYLFQPSYKFDHWYWGNIITSGKSFEFHLPHPYKQGSTVFVTAMFRGASIKNSATNNYDGHQISVQLDLPASVPGENSQDVGEIVPIAGNPFGTNWIGQTMASVSNVGNVTGLSQGKLQHGTNIIRIDVADNGFLDAVLFNWFDITYNREYKADEDFIKFKLQDGFFDKDKLIQFHIEGFSTQQIEIYKLGVSKIVNGKVDVPLLNEKNPYRVIIQDQIYNPDIEYVALTEKAKKKVLSIEEYIPWKEDDKFATLLDNSNKADLLIVTNKLFSEDIGRLKSLKEEAGYTVEVVNVSQIYDVFNYGIKSPLAIRTFFKYAYENWDSSRKLKYIILVGDASFDPKGNITKNSDIVPVLMFTTNSYGAAPSDLQYALISGDDLIPDLIIGRIPATTTDELQNYIDKIEEYQLSPTVSQWRNKALFLSGADRSTLEYNTRKPIFRAQNTRLINLKLPQNIFDYKLNTQRNLAIPDSLDDPEFGSSRELIEYFDDGVTFVNFFGHGGGGIWSDEDLFALDNVEDLNNKGQYPFISSMTCFTGAFENPGREGLAEKILLAKEKGAIAVLASASVGYAYNDFAIKWALHDYLWEDGLTFGESVDLMKINYLTNLVYYTEVGAYSTPSHEFLKTSVVNQYNLLGDPTLEIQKPDKELTVQLSSTTPGSGEQIQINIKSPNQSGLGIVEISDVENVKYFQQNFTLTSGRSTLTYDVPDSSVGKLLKVKAYTSDGLTDASGNAVFNIEGSIIKEVSYEPKNPQVNQEISFRVIEHSFNPIEYMELRNFRSERSTGNNGSTLAMSRINDSVFVSTKNYPGFSTEGVKYFEVFIRDDEGTETKYDLQKIIIEDNRPDLVLDINSIKYGGNDELQLTFQALNESDTELENVLIKSFDNEGIIDSSIYSFTAQESKTIYVPYNPPTYQENRLFRIELDPNDVIDEKNESNNGISQNKLVVTDNIWINQKTGTGNDTLSVLSNWGFYVPQNALTGASSVIQFEAVQISENLLNSDQKDLKFIRLKGSNDTTALSFEIKNSITQFSEPATISAMLDTSLYTFEGIQTPFFFIYNQYLGLWVKTETTLEKSGRISTKVNKNGLYGVFIFDDQKKPFIEVTANGRSLRNDVLLSANPAIALLLQDENGIDLENTLSVKLDGSELSRDDLTIPDSIRSANSIAVLATPELNKGNHSIDIAVGDINGNIQSITRTFNVSGANDLIIHGNYPNPFSNNTIFAYSASISVPRMESLSFKIYTVSGHMIRSKPLMSPEGVDVNDGDQLTPGYHELLWDGKDDDGNDVANGVYFVVIKAAFKDSGSNSDKIFHVKKKLKVARLK